MIIIKIISYQDHNDNKTSSVTITIKIIMITVYQETLTKGKFDKFRSVNTFDKINFAELQHERLKVPLMKLLFTMLIQ